MRRIIYSFLVFTVVGTLGGLVFNAFGWSVGAGVALCGGFALALVATLIET